MGDTEHTFAQARIRLEDIVGQVRKKDISLETSLDLLEEGVRLANACTEQIDQSEWRSVAEGAQAEAPDEGVGPHVVDASAGTDATAAPADTEATSALPDRHPDDVADGVDSGIDEAEEQ